MDKTNLKPLSKKEMLQLVGGKWVEFEGRWVWISAKKKQNISLIDDIFCFSK